MAFLVGVLVGVVAGYYARKYVEDQAKSKDRPL